MIVLDTHALLWWTGLPSHLGPGATRAIREAETLGLPAIIFWEIAMLSRRGRIELGAPVEEWVNIVLSLPRVKAIHLDPAIAVLAESLKMHPDPADRFIVASAIARNARLVTKDKLIRKQKLVTTVW